VQLNSTFQFDSPILTLLSVIYSSVYHMTAVSKHRHCHLTPFWISPFVARILWALALTSIQKWYLRA